MPKVRCNSTANTLGLTSSSAVECTSSLLMLQQLVFLLQVLTCLQEAMTTLTKGHDHAISCTHVDISTKPQVSKSFYEALEVQKHLSFCSKVWANLTCLGHLLLQRLHVFHHHLLLLKTRCHCVSKQFNQLTFMLKLVQRDLRKSYHTTPRGRI